MSSAATAIPAPAKAWAMAAPRPDAAPVTTAIFPSSCATAATLHVPQAQRQRLFHWSLATRRDTRLAHAALGRRRLNERSSKVAGVPDTGTEYAARLGKRRIVLTTIAAIAGMFLA